MKDLFKNMKIAQDPEENRCKAMTQKGKRCQRRQKELKNGFCT